MTTATADELVVVRCQLGERAAFGELVERRQSYRQVDTDPFTAAEATAAATDTDELGRLLDRIELESALAEMASREREVVSLFHLADR